MFRLPVLAAALLVSPAWGPGQPDEGTATAKKPSGIEVGAPIPAFYVRELTGSRPNLAVCLVCQNGDRPVVMISVRRLSKPVERLIEAVDRAVDAHRADGLRGFSIFLAPDAAQLAELKARLVGLATDRKLNLPLTIPVESQTGPAALDFPKEVDALVVLYAEKRIVARYLCQSGDLSGAQIDRMIDAAIRLAAPNGPRGGL